MSVDLELAPKTKRPPGEPCCEPVVYPDVEREQAERMAAVAKALGDPVRLQLIDVLRKHAGKVCVCELVPLFDLSQPTLSHHLKKLREAGIVDSERRGPVGLLLRHPRRTQGADRMAELTARRDPRGGAGALRRRRDLGRRGEAPAATPAAASQRRASAASSAPASTARSATSCPTPRRSASLGCGNPTAVAELHAGETVLDLGSGGGIDVLLSARRVGPTGKAYGLDMTDEMLSSPGRTRPRPGSRSRVAQGRDRGDPASRRDASTSSSPTA